MNLFSKDDKLYELQEIWNSLDPEKAIVASHYDLAKETDHSAEEWKAFLKDGQVAKYLNEELELYKQAQMRKLVQRSTTNDKSVGTAQMLNAIGKSLDDDQVEDHFFIYSYVPPTPEECEAPLVRQENDWRPPEDIVEVEDAQPEMQDNTPVEVVPAQEPEKEVEEDDWF